MRNKVRFVMGFITDMKFARAFGRGDYRRAIQLLEAEVEAHGDEKSVHWRIAYSYMQLKEYEMAIEWGTRGLALNPEDPMILELLGNCYHEQGDPDRAYQCLCHALKQPLREPIELSGLTRWIFKLFSLHPWFRRVEPDRVQRGFDKMRKQDEAWRRRAEEYRKWYVATRGGTRF